MSLRPRALASLVSLALVVAACGSAPASPSPAPSVEPSPSPSPSPRPSPSPSPDPSPSPLPSPSPSPTVAYGDLDGMPVDPALANRLPIAVLIDDNRQARPQSGFNAASVVYQAPADGFETRYMFVYQSGDAKDVGPVRSGRMYFIHWAAETRSAFAHFGGDVQTLAWIRNNGAGLITNVDALFGSAGAFHRISSRPRPHNAYTSTAALRSMASKRGGAATLDPGIYRRTFIDESPIEARGKSQTIRVPYRTNVPSYVYEPKSNLYFRLVDGRPQSDPADGKRVTTRNLVVLFQRYWIDTKIEPGHSRPVIATVGEGAAWIFREGKLTKGKWVKDSVGAPTRLLDANGSEIPLVRGKTFVQIVPTGTKVTVGS